MNEQKLPASFQKLLHEADRPVLVDFWADWCPPCRALAPTIQALAKEFKGRLFVVKVNVDEKPHLSQQYNVQSIPTIILFKNAGVAWRGVGNIPLQQLRAELQRQL